MSLRRIPSQERSRKRFDAIVDAAAELFAEIGFTKATIEAIAQRSGSSVGSLYQFFPNKKAIFRQVAEQALQRAREIHAALLLKHQGESWELLTDRSIDAFFHAAETFPGTRALYKNPALYEEYAESDQLINLEMAQATSMILQSQIPNFSAERGLVVGQVVVQTVSSLMLLATNQPEQAEPIREEAKRMVRSYLSSLLASESRNQPPTD